MEKNKKNYIVSQIHKNKINWWHENILNISQSIKKEVSNLYVYLSQIIIWQKSFYEKKVSKENHYPRERRITMRRSVVEIVTDKFAVICLKKDKVHRANLTEVRVKVYRGREETTFSRSVHVSFLPRSTPTRVEQHAISLP